MQGYRVSVLAGAAAAVLASFVLASCNNNTTTTATTAPAAPASTAPLPAGMPDIQGIWWATSYSPKLTPVGGGDPPLSDAGKMQYAMNKAGLKDGTLQDRSRTVCIPDGIPRLMKSPYPFEIFQVPLGQLTMIHELNHEFRVIPVDGPVKTYEELEPYENYNGYSSAHYDGDTVAITTNGMVVDTLLDSTGLPHSDKMVVTERLKKINPKQLEDVVTIHDPDMYTADWQARFVYDSRNDIRIEDYSCNDAEHRDLSSVKGVAEARALRSSGKLFD